LNIDLASSDIVAVLSTIINGCVNYPIAPKRTKKSSFPSVSFFHKPSPYRISKC
jgi:hypothetical protein